MITEVKNYLLSRGIKPSVQRIAIMEYLMTHRTHPTADTIYWDLSPKMPTLSKTTVYNTLKLFSEQGAVLSLDIDDKNTHYDGDTSVHAHFRCKRCGVIFDLPIEGVNMVDPKLLDGFVVTEMNAYYKGFCDKCVSEAELKNSPNRVN